MDHPMGAERSLEGEDRDLQVRLNTPASSVKLELSMFKSAIATLFGLTLALGSTGAAQAQAPAPAKASAPLSADSLVGDLMKDPDAKAVLTADIPDVVTNPQLTMAYAMKLREIAQFEPALTAETLAKIDKDLAAMQAKRGR
jgi:hypothetical protein